MCVCVCIGGSLDRQWQVWGEIPFKRCLYQHNTTVEHCHMAPPIFIFNHNKQYISPVADNRPTHLKKKGSITGMKILHNILKELFSLKVEVKNCIVDTWFTFSAFRINIYQNNWVNGQLWWFYFFFFESFWSKCSVYACVRLTMSTWQPVTRLTREKGQKTDTCHAGWHNAFL